MLITLCKEAEKQNNKKGLVKRMTLENVGEILMNP